jgi:hypothetical protein
MSPLLAKILVTGSVTAFARVIWKSDALNESPLMCESRKPSSFCFEMADGRISFTLIAELGAIPPASRPSM